MDRENKSFDENGLQFAWDSSSLKTFETCPRKYFYEIIEGWEPFDKSVHLVFGGHYASALERYYKFRAMGQTMADALDNVLALALLETWNHKTIDGRRQPGGAPWISGHPAKTRENLIRSIVWYVDQFDGEGVEVVTLRDGKPAVEYSFTVELTDDILWCGHIDRLVTYAGDYYIMDQKAQPITSRILTPWGWVRIGDLEVGMFAMGVEGTPVKIKGLYPKGVTKVFRVEFSDGSVVECGEDHLWTVGTQFSDKWQTLPLTKIVQKTHKRYHVPIMKAAQFAYNDLPLDPFVLGTLLGDGYLAGNSIQLSTSHDWLIEAVAGRLNGDEIHKSSEFNYSLTIKGGRTLSAIRELGLKDKKSRDKFIPEQYLFASEAQRRDLLNGLLLTDGSWNGNSRIYDTMSLQLVKDVCSLVRSLGGQARFRDRGDDCYRASLRMPEFPTGLGRRYIKSVKEIGKAETVCIEVDAEDGLYITDDYVVTHNTTGHTITQRFFDQFNPDTQMTGYTFAGQIIYNLPVKGVIIDGAQIAVGFTRFERGYTFRTQDQLEEWHQDAVHNIARARSMTQENYFPMNTTACGNYGGCPFRDVCSRPKAVRENFLKQKFVKSRNWDPLERR